MVVKVWRAMWNVSSFQFHKSGGFPLKTNSFFDYSNRKIGFLFLTLIPEAIGYLICFDIYGIELLFSSNVHLQWLYGALFG